MGEFPDFTEERKDLLKELANIGVGNATTSLSKLLDNEKIKMSVPEVAVVPLKDITDYLEEEKPIAAIFFEAKSGDLKLTLMFMLSLESAGLLVNKVMQTNSQGLGEMEQSALLEIGNIFNTSYLNALSDVTNLTFLPNPPNLAVDMGGAILGTVIAETNMIDDHIILSINSITTEKDDLSGTIFVFPFYGSLNRLFETMGV